MRRGKSRYQGFKDDVDDDDDDDDDDERGEPKLWPSGLLMICTRVRLLCPYVASQPQMSRPLVACQVLHAVLALEHWLLLGDFSCLTRKHQKGDVTAVISARSEQRSAIR